MTSIVETAKALRAELGRASMGEGDVSVEIRITRPMIAAVLVELSHLRRFQGKGSPMPSTVEEVSMHTEAGPIRFVCMEGEP
jgi:hypothetical protein